MVVAMRVAIAGGSGFVGSALVSYLIRLGIRPRLLVRREIDSSDVVQCIGDAVTGEGLDSFLAGADICVNLIGKFGESFDKLIDANVISSKNIAEAIIRNGVKKFIHLSSAAVYGKAMIDHDPTEGEPAFPDTEYGLTKKLGEEVVGFYSKQRNGYAYTILRPTNIYGPGAKAGTLYKFIQRIKTGEGMMITGDGSQIRDFVHVADVCALIYKLIRSPFDHNVINVGSGSSVTLNELVPIFEHIYSHKIPTYYTAKEMGHVARLAVDTTRMRTLVGPCTYTLSEGIKTCA